MYGKCIFCQFRDKDKEFIGNLAFVKADDFPVSKYHSLIIPKRHFESFFDITQEELLEINQLLKMCKKQILSKDKTVAGFNIGVNIGIVSGQSIFHVHVHLIPRRAGDLENPRGGIRGIFPDKRGY